MKRRTMMFFGLFVLAFSSLLLFTTMTHAAILIDQANLPSVIQAANKGNRLAPYNLGLLYENGIGVAKDMAIARE